MKGGDGMKLEFNKKYTPAIFILGIIACLTLVLYSTYFFVATRSYSQYEKQMLKVMSDVNALNDSTSSLIKGQTIDTECSQVKVKKISDDLAAVKTAVQSITPTNNYYSCHSEFMEGLNFNILMYRQLEAMLSNPNSTDIDKSLEELKNYREKCLASYSNVHIKKQKMTLSKNCIKFFDCSSSYMADLIRVRKDSQIAQSQNLQFIDNLDGCFNKFLSLKSNYKIALASSRKSDNYDELLNSISKNSLSFEAMKADFSNLTVPANGLELYKSLKIAFDDYSSYLSSIKAAVEIEKIEMKNASPNNGSMEAAYLLADEKYSASDSSLDKFFEIYNDYKSKNAKQQ